MIIHLNLACSVSSARLVVASVTNSYCRTIWRNECDSAQSTYQSRGRYHILDKNFAFLCLFQWLEIPACNRLPTCLALTSCKGNAYHLDESLELLVSCPWSFLDSEGTVGWRWESRAVEQALQPTWCETAFVTWFQNRGNWYGRLSMNWWLQYPPAARTPFSTISRYVWLSWNSSSEVGLLNQHHPSICCSQR